MLVFLIKDASLIAKACTDFQLNPQLLQQGLGFPERIEPAVRHLCGHRGSRDDTESQKTTKTDASELCAGTVCHLSRFLEHDATLLQSKPVDYTGLTL